MDYESDDNQQQPQQQENPIYAEVEGQKIYLKGLDYELLEKQKQKQNKIGMVDIESIKNKLNLYSDRLKVKNPQKQNKIKSQQIQQYQNDPLTMNIIRVIKKLKDKSKPTLNINTSYLFDTRYHFGLLLPKIIIRRNLKHQNISKYVKINQQIIQKFKQLLTDKYQPIQINKINQISNIDQDDDDIFNQTKINNLNDIQVGRKLNFGVKDSDIFQKYQSKPNQEIKPKQEEFDKYEFMRKKIKISVEGHDDGYGQCYAETGPNLEEMKQMKKLGIQLFGDQKEYKQKQKKINIHKDYQKIKKIIQEKSKK